ncbi:RluA family pseudouridine synthase [Kocuria palustris]|nr:RluA family pseudouridine synthase [Kocuria palustris]
MKRRPGPAKEAAAAAKAKYRDVNGFRIRQQVMDKTHLTAAKQMDNADLDASKTIDEEESEGASYVFDGGLRRVTPYYFTYLTYAKQRWLGRNILDVFTDEFRDRAPEFYKHKIAAGEVTVNQKPANLDTILKNGDLISHRCLRREPPVPTTPIRIVYEDDQIIAIDKPGGIPVHPAGRYRYNSVTKILEHERGVLAHPCNRLDRLTLGLMFMGKLAKGAEWMVKQIRERLVRKEYIARVKGEFPLGKHRVDQPLKLIQPKIGLNRVDPEGKEATTEFQRVYYDPELDTLVVKCYPYTGRTHQIRVHLQYLGHPIANDPIYSNEYVWGPELGKDNQGDNDVIIPRLEEMGITRPCQLWLHPNADGEVITLEIREVLGMPLYSEPGVNDMELWLHAYRYLALDDAEDLWTYQTQYPEWAIAPARKFMELALEEAKKCGPTDTQFNVGCVITHEGKVISTGHLRELEGNTHAEQNALAKLDHLPEGLELYTTMEPCSLRLSGNLPCTDRILATLIKTVFVGVSEPDTFVKNNTSVSRLREAGIEYVVIPGYEEDILATATYGHPKKESTETATETAEEGDQPTNEEA